MWKFEFLEHWPTDNRGLHRRRGKTRLQADLGQVGDFNDRYFSNLERMSRSRFYVDIRCMCMLLLAAPLFVAPPTSVARNS
jgi:hypothetical protein